MINIPKKQFLHNTVYRDLSHVEIDNIAYSLKEDVYNIPPPETRENYFPGDDLSYWLSGLYDYTQIDKYIISRFDPNTPLSVLDFGGSSGRVFRHFLYRNKKNNLCLTDLNQESINFILQYIYNNKNNIVKSNYTPPLPFDDDQFDIIYGFSVFTHLDTLEKDWLIELNRIAKKGAYLYLTIHSDITWISIKDTYLNDFLINDPEFKNLYESCPKAMPVSKLVFNKNYYGDDKLVYQNMLQVFHHSDYIKKEWSKIFSVQEILHNQHSTQTVIILKKE